MTPVKLHRGTDGNKLFVHDGAHRAAAAKRLGRKTIATDIFNWTAKSRRMWEITERLNWTELTALERAEWIAEWIGTMGTVTLEDAIRAISANKRIGKKNGTRAAVKKLGIDKDEARAAKKVAALPEKAKELARATGLDDSPRMLFDATRSKDSVAFLRDVVDRSVFRA